MSETSIEQLPLFEAMGYEPPPRCTIEVVEGMTDQQIIALSHALLQVRSALKAFVDHVGDQLDLPEGLYKKMLENDIETTISPVLLTEEQVLVRITIAAAKPFTWITLYTDIMGSFYEKIPPVSRLPDQLPEYPKIKVVRQLTTQQLEELTLCLLNFEFGLKWFARDHTNHVSSPEKNGTKGYVLSQGVAREVIEGKVPSSITPDTFVDGKVALGVTLDAVLRSKHAKGSELHDVITAVYLDAAGQDVTHEVTEYISRSHIGGQSQKSCSCQKKCNCDN